MWLGGDGSREDSWKGPKNQGLLEQGKKICSSSKSKELLQLKPTGKTRKKSEKQKGAKTRVSQCCYQKASVVY